AGGARITFGGMTGALLVPHQDMLDLALLEQFVIDRKHRPAGITEDVLDAMIDQRAHDHGCARHLVGVALVAHGLAPDALLSAAFSVASFEKIKRGPRGPLHTARSWMA